MRKPETIGHQAESTWGQNRGEAVLTTEAAPIEKPFYGLMPETLVLRARVQLERAPLTMVVDQGGQRIPLTDQRLYTEEGQDILHGCGIARVWFIFEGTAFALQGDVLRPWGVREALPFSRGDTVFEQRYVLPPAEVSCIQAAGSLSLFPLGARLRHAANPISIEPVFFFAESTAATPAVKFVLLEDLVHLRAQRQAPALNIEVVPKTLEEWLAEGGVNFSLKSPFYGTYTSIQAMPVGQSQSLVDFMFRCWLYP